MLSRIYQALLVALSQLCLGCNLMSEKVQFDWINNSEHDLWVRGYVYGQTNKPIEVGPGWLRPVSQMALKSLGDYTNIGPTLLIQWKYDWPESTRVQLDATPWREQTVDLSRLIDLNHFRGRVWLRFDGTQWGVYPQTDAEHAEQVKYALPSFAPWMPRLTDTPYKQFKMAEENPALYEQIDEGFFTRFRPPDRPVR